MTEGRVHLQPLRGKMSFRKGQRGIPLTQALSYGTRLQHICKFSGNATMQGLYHLRSCTDSACLTSALTVAGWNE